MKSSIYYSIFLLLFVFFAHNKSNFGAENWYEIKTRNFQITGNANQNEIVEVAKNLERLHQVFARIFPKTNIQTPFTTKIIVFNDKASLNGYKITKSENKYFVSANDVNYGITAPNNAEAFEQICSGYAKFLLENNIGRNNIPTWLFEGLAEYFQTIKYTDESRFDFGNSPKNVTILQQNKLIPTVILLDSDNFTFQNQGEDRKNLFRAQSWALLQFLLKDTNTFKKIEKFIELRKLGTEAKKSFNEAFQISISQLNNDLSMFIASNVFKTQIGELGSEFSVKPIQTIESKGLAVIADFLFYSSRLKESEAMVEKALKVEPKETLAITTLALIKAGQFYYDEAKKIAQKAIEFEPDNFLNHYRLAVVLSKRGMTEHGFVSGYSGALAEEMRESLQRSIALNPELTAHYALLAFVNYVRNEQLDESIKIVNQVSQIAPGNHQYQLRLAELNLRKEKFLEARKIAYQVLQNTPNEGVKLYAQNTIQRIDATEYQLERIRNEKAKYVNDDIVSDKPLSDEEIKKLREKATNDQIRAALRRPNSDEIRIFGSLKRIECAKNKVDFFISTSNGQIRIQSSSFDGITLLSLVEEMSDYRLGCGTVVKDNNASIIYKKNSNKTEALVSIEFVPKGFQL